MSNNIRGRGMSNTIRGRGMSHTIRGRGVSNTIRGRGMSHTIRGRGMSHTIRGRGVSNTIRGRGMSHTIRGRGVSNTIRGRGMSHTIIWTGHLFGGFTVAYTNDWGSPISVEVNKSHRMPKRAPNLHKTRPTTSPPQPSTSASYRCYLSRVDQADHLTRWIRKEITHFIPERDNEDLPIASHRAW